MSEHQQVSLPDGRQLGYRVLGAPDGAPVVFHHGVPGTSLDGGWFEEVAKAHDVRLIAVDRPGMGASSRARGRRVADVADDVARLLDALSIDAHVQLGASGGAPFALACAARLGARVTSVFVVSGVGPIDAAMEHASGPSKMMSFLSRRAPVLLLPLMASMARAAKRGTFADQVSRSLCAADQAILADAGFRALWEKSVTVATGAGARAMRDDVLAVAGNWGFAPEDVNTDVTWWHGREDNSVPARAIEPFIARLPRVRAEWLEGEGHLLVWPRRDEVFAALASG